MYTMLGLFGFGVWAFAKDFTNVSYETSVDKKLAELGEDYIEAGIRFYDKLLKKNIALRNIANDGTYSAKGNINYFLRQKSLPLTLRKAFFEQELKKIRGETINDGATTEL